MLAHSSLAVLATLSTTRDIHELTITLVFSSSTPASPGRLQVSLIPALPAGRLCPRPSAPAPICRQSAAGRASYSLSGSPSLPHSDDTCPSLQRIAALHFSRRRKAPHSWPAFPPAGGTIIPQSAAFRAPLLSGPVLGHSGPSLQPCRGVFYPSRRFWPSLLTPTGQTVTTSRGPDPMLSALSSSTPAIFLAIIPLSEQRTDQGGVNVTRNRRAQGRRRSRPPRLTTRRRHGVGIHAYLASLFEQLLAQCRTALNGTHAALLLE